MYAAVHPWAVINGGINRRVSSATRRTTWRRSHDPESGITWGFGSDGSRANQILPFETLRLGGDRQDGRRQDRCCGRRSAARTRSSRTRARTRISSSRKTTSARSKPGKLADLVVLDRDYLTIPGGRDQGHQAGDDHGRRADRVRCGAQTGRDRPSAGRAEVLHGRVVFTGALNEGAARSVSSRSALLALPCAAYAQEAVLTGTVTDSTGGVLPGVTVTAVHEATGNRFVAVTDERGIYRIPARVGAYQMTAELQGFTTVTRTGLQLLVGQTVDVNLQMAPSTVQETVTVTAEAPLLNVATSSLGGNIDPAAGAGAAGAGPQLDVAGDARARQPDDIAGARPRRSPDRNTGEQREFQFSIDGQQVASELGFGGQPRYSQDSIAEFQFISNRFDATQGRSSGVQVRAITRSGTNTFSGSVRGNFRDSAFNAENPVLNRVVPIDNQQLAFTLGGPILPRRLHFFGHFEYEREPRTSIWNTPYPAFNVELEGKRHDQDGRRPPRLSAVADMRA